MESLAKIVDKFLELHRYQTPYDTMDWLHELSTRLGIADMQFIAGINGFIAGRNEHFNENFELLANRRVENIVWETTACNSPYTGFANLVCECFSHKPRTREKLLEIEAVVSCVLGRETKKYEHKFAKSLSMTRELLQLENAQVDVH